MKYSELHVRSVIIPAGTVIGAPLAPFKLERKAAPDELTEEINSYRWEYDRCTTRYDGRNGTCTQPDRDYEVMNLAVNDKVFVTLRGYYESSPLVLVESSYENGTLRLGVSGNKPTIAVLGENTASRTSYSAGSLIEYDDAGLIAGSTAYVLLQDSVFTGVIEFHNTVDDRSIGFRWPINLAVLGRFVIPARAIDYSEGSPELSNFYRTDMHDDEELARYVRAWDAYPGDTYPYMLPIPTDAGDDSWVADDPPGYLERYWSAMVAPACLLQGAVAVLDQKLGPVQPVNLLAEAAKAGQVIVPDDMANYISQVGGIIPLRMPALQTSLLAKSWMTDDDNLPPDDTGIVLWFSMIGKPNVKIAVPLMTNYVVAAQEPDTEGNPLWLELVRKELVNPGVLLVGPVPVGLGEVRLAEGPSIVTAMPAVQVLPSSTIDDLSASQDSAWLRLKFYALTDYEFYTGEAYWILANLAKGYSDLSTGVSKAMVPGVYRLTTDVSLDVASQE